MTRVFSNYVTLLWVSGSIWTAIPADAAVQRSPEQETLWLSSRLKPIPDEEWSAVAGPKAAERYEIAKGDTLYDLSKRLFGDVRYWPKIWALNNGAITNPHLIRPGNHVAFLPGTGTSLPGLAIQGPGGGEPVLVAAASTTTDAGPAPAAATPSPGSPGSSEEWKLLKGKQPWELSADILPDEVDEQGIDRRSRVLFKGAHGFNLTSFVSSEEIEPLGEIVAGRHFGTFFTLGDMVSIAAEQELQVGQSYTVTSEPNEIYSSESGRSGYSYPVTGSVRIIGVKDGTFVGTIEKSSDLTARGALLIPEVPRVKALSAIPGPTPVEGHLIVDLRESTHTTAQHKTVYIDRGSDDGVREGMVFRAYQHEDPATEDTITESDYIISADLMVVQVSERVSTAIVLRSLVPLENGARVVLLTDVSDLNEKKDIREIDPSKGAERGELEQVDELDVSGGLGNKEAKELRQLERWEKNGDPLAIPLEPAEQPAPGEEQPPEDDSTDGLPTDDASTAEETLADDALPPPPDEAMPDDALKEPASSGTAPTAPPPPVVPPAEEGAIPTSDSVPDASGDSAPPADDSAELEALLNQ